MLSTDSIPAFSLATMATFGGLGLVALALGLLARRYSAGAFAIGIAGLLTLTTASTWIALAYTGLTPQPGSPGPGQGRSNEPKPPSQAPSASSASDDTPVQAQHEFERAKRTASQCHDELSATKASLRQDSDRLAKATHDLTIATARIRELEAAQRETAAGRLRKELSSRIANGFIMHPTEHGELVEGHQGAWYLVRLEVRGSPITFADRQFRIPGAAQDIVSSALMLQRTVLKRLADANVPFRLFVRGTADARRIAGPTEAPETREIRVRPRRHDGTYARKSEPQQLQQSVRNEELPALRAGWVRGLIWRALGLPEETAMAILENPPAPGQERTVELFLFVSW